MRQTDSLGVLDRPADPGLDDLPAGAVDVAAAVSADRASFDRPSFGRAPLGQAPLDRPSFGRAPLDRPSFGRAPLDRPSFGRVPLDRQHLGRIVGAVAADPGRWRGPVSFDAGRRWFRRLELADDYEVWLLSWLPGQSTGFHDHGRATGAFAVAQGRVQERTVDRRSHVRHRTIAPGRPRLFGSRHVHDVVNDFASPAVTVHAYSPPLTAMRRYELTASGLIHVGTDRAEQDW